MNGIRVPLHVKVMVSYVLVVALVLIPMLVYLQTSLEEELAEAAFHQMRSEIEVLAHRLSVAEEGRHEAVAELLVAAMPDRVTILRPDGRVLGDSAVPVEELDNHRSRPEVSLALAEGYGRSRRFSRSTEQTRLYVARRYPLEGPTRGVVRLSVPVENLHGPIDRAFMVLKQAGALGLTAALLLSLVAAFVVSLPLRRLTTAARAFSAGDFGHEVNVHSKDELGDAADALSELAVQLRETLVAAGSGSATLKGILDDLPSGMIIYDQDGDPRFVSARARELCDLIGAEEHARVKQIARLPDQAEAQRLAVEEGRTVVRKLNLPWLPSASLEARWINVYSPSGQYESALVIVDRHLDEEQEKLSKALNGTVILLREAAKVTRAAEKPDLSVNLEQEADRLERWASWTDPDAQDVMAVDLTELCQLAARQLEARTELRKIKLKFELPESTTHVVESGGRSCRALRGFLETAVRSSKKGSNISIAGEVQNGCVRLSLKTKDATVDFAPVERLAAKAGGRIGSKRLGDASYVWMTIPRA